VVEHLEENVSEAALRIAESKLREIGESLRAARSRKTLEDQTRLAAGSSDNGTVIGKESDAHDPRIS
jgi:hypothetical protein